MDCENIEKLIRKYEMGDVDYFEKRKVEKHIRSCERCKKKYGAMILMTALLFSSAKIKKTDLLKKTIAAYALKTLIALLITGSTAVAVMEYNNNIALKKSAAEKAKKSTVVESIIGTAEEKSETAVEKEEDKTLGGTKATTSGIRIKSESGGREVIINIDDKNMKIKNRSEK